MQLRNGDQELRTTLESEQWDQLEPFAFSKLKQASILLELKDHSKSLQILLKVAQICRFPLCSCNPLNPVFTIAANILTLITECALKQAVTNVLRHTLTCVSFLPCEQLITPRAIRYEMIRCFDGVPISQEDAVVNIFWFDWGMVDGPFLTIFLLYLNYVALCQTPQETVCIILMNWFLNWYKGPLGHRETCLNLLGWVHKERGNVNLAVQCFARSLKKRPTHNAACWHLCFLICGI